MGAGISSSISNFFARHRRWLPYVAIFVAIALVPAAALVVSNGGDDEEAAPTTTTSTTTTSTTTTPPPPPPPPTLPLLGVPGGPLNKAALAVKIDTTEKARPPVGLLQADVVYEEMVEGGLTRLMAIFHSQDPGTVGPVRSARSSDIAFLGEVGRPLFAWSGANVDFAALIQAANLVDVGPGAAGDAYWRDRGRTAPANLFASPEQLRGIGASLDGTAAAIDPPPMFTYRPDGQALAGPGLAPNGGFQTNGNGVRTSVVWNWDPATGRYVRTQSGTPHVDVDGAQVSAMNVLVRFTPYIDSGYVDTTGAMVPEAAALGEGEALLLTQGMVVPAHWSKAAVETPTTYTLADGTPLLLTPGQTWVEVIPPGSGDLF